MASLKYVVVFSLIIMMLAHSYADEFKESNELKEPNDLKSKEIFAPVLVKRSPDQGGSNSQWPHKGSGTGSKGKGYFGG